MRPIDLGLSRKPEARSASSTGRTAGKQALELGFVEHGARADDLQAQGAPEFPSRQIVEDHAGICLSKARAMVSLSPAPRESPSLDLARDRLRDRDLSKEPLQEAELFDLLEVDQACSRRLRLEP